MTSMNRRRFLARTGAALAVAAASSVTHAADQKKVVVVWSEGTAPKNVFPDDINGAVVDGLKTDSIAAQQGISASAVKQHIALICNKLGAATRAEAVAIALRKHLLKM